MISLFNNPIERFCLLIKTTTYPYQIGLEIGFSAVIHKIVLIFLERGNTRTKVYFQIT